MPFEATIADFAAALRDPATPPPAATRGRKGAPDGRRFAVYRNNVAVGLIGAIESRYPATRRILGEQAFRGLARAYVQAEKPRSPVLIAYGESFPDFITGSCEILGFPYLADVARLENAWVEAYHAADADAASLAYLAALDPPRLAGAQIQFPPAARLILFGTP